MMKTALAVAVAALAVAMVLPASAGSVNYFKHLQRIRDDADLLAIQCLLSDANEGCSEAMTEFKGQLPIVAASNCAECTDLEREFVTAFFKDLFIHNPNWAKKIQDKYDPTGEYRRKFGEIWRKKGVPIY